jgi:peptidoglycan/LPS O-acetylase OafA/YrhL
MSQKSLTYMPHIDGLRALAVLGVLLYHLDLKQLGGGFSGVDIFFVISGYLITSIIAADMRDGKFSFANFYARRIRRIFPALFVMLIASAIGAILFLGPHHFYEFFRSWRYAGAQISNFLFARGFDYFALRTDYPPLLHTWTLGVEEQFYLIWPMLLLVLLKFKKVGLWIGLAILSMASLAYSAYLVQVDPQKAFYLLPSRGWELALGGALALHRLPTVAKRGADILSVAGLVLIAGSFMFLSAENFPGFSALFPCLGAALFIYAAQGQTGIGHKILSARPLVWTGLISYSLYLWHWPLIAFYKTYFTPELSIAVQIGIGLLSFALAYLSYRFVEIPTRKISWSSWKIIALCIGMIVLFIVAGNVFKKFNDAPWRLQHKIAGDLRDPHAYDKLCAAQGGPEHLEGCIIGPNKDAYEVLLAGDSMSSQYVPMVLEWAKERGLTVRLYMLGGCKTWLAKKDTAADQGLARNKDYCQQISDNFPQMMAESKALKFVILSGFLPEASTATREALASIKQSKRHTVFLGQSPLFKEDPHDCYIKNNLLIAKIFPRGDNRACYALDPAYFADRMKETEPAFRSLLKDVGIPYFETGKIMGEVTQDREGHFMFRDKDHLNRYGAIYLLPSFREFMKD